ncbi:DUF2179 domain-containing protein [Candidatus Woesearchaeota archaeon]|nr:DUF2179 domain-containing protein [Candidatus Woesearchaeota archaeon]
MALAFFDSNLYAYFIIPVLIFCARVVDVSIGTIRVIFISRGFKYLAPVMGFFEVLIWLLAIRQILLNLSNVFCFLAYGLGFAAGTYVGMVIEERISMGKVIIRIITGRDAVQLLDALKSKRYTFTTIGADGPDDKVKIIFTIINRHDTKKVLDLVNEYNPNAFCSIEDVRFSFDGDVSESHQRDSSFLSRMKKLVK